MTAIAICYAITPLLQWSRWLGWWQLVAVLSMIVVDGVLFQFRYYYVWLYALSYVMALRKVNIRQVCLLAVVTVVLTGRMQWTDLVDSSLLGRFWRCMAGLLLLSAILLAARAVAFRKPAVVSVLSKYSYYVYIVHHLLIMMPFSILAWPLGIVSKWIVLTFALWASTLLLYQLSQRVGSLVGSRFSQKNGLV